jgi:hypothetical protein
MLTYGSKDSLVKVATTDAGLEDTHAYASMEALEQQVLNGGSPCCSEPRAVLQDWQHCSGISEHGVYPVATMLSCHNDMRSPTYILITARTQ